jgi:hypothetical protein
MQLRLALGNKGFNGWLTAKRRFLATLNGIVAAVPLDEPEDGGDAITTFMAEYLPAASAPTPQGKIVFRCGEDPSGCELTW